MTKSLSVWLSRFRAAWCVLKGGRIISTREQFLMNQIKDLEQHIRVLEDRLL